MQQLDWFNCMQRLKEKHKEIAVLIEGKSVAYVDIPNHFNVGDLLIYKGTEAFFDRYAINVAYRSGTSGIDFDKLKEVEVILLHGGGNFGDLYSTHQTLRESIISAFKNKKIICLPQSIHFESETQLQRSAAIFSAHPDLHLFVRDNVSLEVARRFSKDATLMPDMAHSLHPLVDQREAGISNISPPKILNLLRLDKEKTGQIGRINKKGFDWINLITASDQRIQKLYLKLLIFPFFRQRALTVWENLSDEIIFRAIDYVSSHTIIHTDRLHGFILAALLGKEVSLKDNGYGKNSNYQQAWLKAYPYLEITSYE